MANSARENQQAEGKGIEPNRTDSQNSFSGNNFGDDSETVRAKTYLFDDDSDSVASLKQRIQDALHSAWWEPQRLAAVETRENRKAVEPMRSNLAVLVEAWECPQPEMRKAPVFTEAQRRPGIPSPFETISDELSIKSSCHPTFSKLSDLSDMITGSRDAV